MLAPAELARILSRDPGVASRVLHIASSAFFGDAHTTGSLPEAIRAVGSSTLRTVLPAAQVLAPIEDEALRAVGLDPRGERQHALLVSELAARLVPPKLAELARTAGLLHDAGTLLLAAQAPEAYRALRTRAGQTPAPLASLEHSVFGASHGDLAAYLLGLWGLPTEVVEGVRRHHDPVPRPDVAVAVHIASALANQVRGDGASAIDPELQVELGGRLDLVAWRAQAAAIARELGQK